jgi:hypothetical protein
MSFSPQSESRNSLNKQHRIEASAIINTNIVGLKSALFELFSRLGIGATISSNAESSTTILFEGPATLVTRAKKKLEETLSEEFPGVETVWNDTKDSSEQLSKVTIVETPANFKRSKSSGDLKEKSVEELSLGASANTEFVKKHVESVLGRLGPFGRFVGLAAPEKHITIEYLGSSPTAESVKLFSKARFPFALKFQQRRLIDCFMKYPKHSHLILASR